MDGKTLSAAEQPSGRTTIRTRIASNHPLPAYGGVQLSERVLEQIAKAVGADAIPMVVNHDHGRPLNARCLQVEVVEQSDGYKAVEATHEVDTEAWESFQDELGALGVPGGMSFTCSETIAEFAANDASKTGHFKLAADAHHFTDAAIEESAAALADVGGGRIERLYQFNAVPACRIVVEYVQQSGGLETAVEGIAVGVAGSAIYEALKRLLKRRSTTPTPAEPPPMVEIHTKTEPNGVTRQRLLLRTDNDDVIKHALDNFTEGIKNPNPLLEGDDNKGHWIGP
jgi:hypothetical protein